VPADRVLQILKVAEAADFACAVPFPRDVCLTDVGRTGITIRVGDAIREVWWDGKTYVEQSQNIGRVRDAVFSLSNVFGHKFDWGPFGTTPYPCRVEHEKPAG
jgi:hypothetical protein